MANSETEMIFMPRWYPVAQVAQMLNYRESKVRMLTITGQLRAIKDRRSRRILPERAEATFKITPRRPRISRQVEPMYELPLLQRIRGLRLAHDSVREAAAQVRVRAESRDRYSRCGAQALRLVC
jgi:hypothetical protein